MVAGLHSPSVPRLSAGPESQTPGEKRVGGSDASRKPLDALPPMCCSLPRRGPSAAAALLLPLPQPPL